MTRVTFVLVEKQFVTAASNWHLKAELTRVGKPPGSFQFFTLKYSKYIEIMYFNMYEVILKAVPQAAFCQPVWMLLLPSLCSSADIRSVLWQRGLGSVCEELLRSPLAAAELNSGVRGAVSALVHSSPSWALALWQRWCLKWHSGNTMKHCFSYLDWRLFPVYLTNAFTLILRMGRMWPVEKDHACLTALLKLQVEGNLSPCSSPVGGWMDCECHSLAPRSPARLCEGVQHRWLWLLTYLLVSWLCACACISVLFPEGAVPADRFTHTLHTHSSVSVHRGSSPQRSGVRREEILSFLSRGELRTAAARRGGVFSAQV